ncbi:MAG: DUF1697 domain-containing protein [Methanobacteriaceae archaeon]
MPSKKYIVFLRGINVGGRNKIKMDQLKSVFSILFLTVIIRTIMTVKTYLN